jgi:hypothetical protein
VDRYQIARKEITKTGLYRFPSTSNISQIVRYIDYCRKNEASFMADNIAVAVLETALIKVSKHICIPVLVRDLEQARLLSTVYSYRPIYSIEGLNSYPSFSLAICYNCEPPKNIKPYIIVYDKTL